MNCLYLGEVPSLLAVARVFKFVVLDLRIPSHTKYVVQSMSCKTSITNYQLISVPAPGPNFQWICRGSLRTSCCRWYQASICFHLLNIKLPVLPSSVSNQILCPFLQTKNILFLTHSFSRDVGIYETTRNRHQAHYWAWSFFIPLIRNLWIKKHYKREPGPQHWSQRWDSELARHVLICTRCGL